MIRAQEQGGEIPNLIYRMPAGVGGGFNHHLIGTLANNRASLSFVTGAHNMKFGYQGGFNNPSQTYTYFNEVILVRLQRRRAEPAHAGHHGQRFAGPHQDRAQPRGRPRSTRRISGRSNRLTLQGGIRYDYYLTNYPESDDRRPGLHGRRRRRRSSTRRGRRRASAGTTSRRAWASPTTCSATARRRSSSTSASTCRPFSATNTDLDLNPIIRTAISTTRTWTDTNKDFVAELRPGEHGEERRVRGDGQQEPRARGVRPDLRPGLHRGLGRRVRTTGAWASRSSRKWCRACR